MNILVIKQTSLGDVLHASGHIRTIKQNFPHCKLVLLTAESSAAIYRHNPAVDEMILFESYWIKKNIWRHPLRALRRIARAIASVRAQHFDMAFDLQGLARSVLFLYVARAQQKYVKGNWLGLMQFRDQTLHAIAEMDGVLRRARLSVIDTSMEFCTGVEAHQTIDKLIARINPSKKPLLIFSPFSRWQSKDWPIAHYVEIAAQIADDYVIVFTSAEAARSDIDEAIKECSVAPINLAGMLSLTEFAELVGRATLMLTGDSFPMHVGSAQNTPVVALFGPTDETRTGPIGALHEIIRAPDCRRCDRAGCQRHCLHKISTQTVLRVLRARLAKSKR